MQRIRIATPGTSRIVLFFFFGLTGLVIAFPGAVLPALAQQWNLQDSQAGFLFFLLWSGSSLGALLARGAPERALLAGTALFAIVCGMLVHTESRAVALWLFAFYGISLGIIMTSISLLCSTRSAAPGREMNRINLFWAGGACLCPALFRSIRSGHSLCSAFVIFSFFSTVLMFWILAVEVHGVRDFERLQALRKLKSGKSRLPFAYAAITALITGVESTTGGWIATHVQRLQHSASAGIVAVFCFWLGLFAGRALIGGGFLSNWQDRTLIRIAMLLTCLSVFAMVIGASEVAVLPAVFLVGFCGGPIYPLLVGMAVVRFRGNLVFFMGGVGASVLPWLTGVVSSGTGSLRVALLVPGIAAVVMVLMAWPAMRVIHSETAEEAFAGEAL